MLFRTPRELCCRIGWERYGFPMAHDEIAGSILYVLVVLASAVHVIRNCRTIGEPPLLHVTGTIILWPFFYLIGWLWIWPGSLRRSLFGGSIRDLAQAKAFERYSNSRSGRGLGDFKRGGR